jgi:hypothetical protein
MQPETIINLVAGGALAAFLAKLLQAQYEARIADFKERIKEQSSLLNALTKALGDQEQPGKGD